MLLVWSRLECSGEGNRYLELSEVPPFTCSTWLCKSLVRILPCRSLSASSLDQMVDMGDASSPLFRGIILSNTSLAVFDTLFIGSLVYRTVPLRTEKGSCCFFVVKKTTTTRRSRTRRCGTHCWSLEAHERGQWHDWTYSTNNSLPRASSQI